VLSTKITKSIIILMAVLLVTTLGFVNIGICSPTINISIVPPIEGIMFTSENLTVKVSVTYGNPSNYPFPNPSIIQVTYYLDQRLISQIPLALTSQDMFGFNANGEILLTNMSQGPHKLLITGEASGTYYLSDQTFSDVPLTPVSTSFFVNLGIAPIVAIVRSTEYKTNQAFVNITVDRNDSTLSYSLDGHANVTLPQTESIQIGSQYQYNLTYSALSNGMHILKAYATDSYGNIGSTMANFRINNTIEKPTQGTLSISSIAILSGVIAGVVIVSVALLVIYRKQNLKRNNKPNIS
jgi:hypothetical protein